MSDFKENIIKALKDQYKKYLRALEHHDGYEQGKALGAIGIHSRRLNNEYEMSMQQIHKLIFEAEEEYRKEKAGQTGRR